MNAVETLKAARAWHWVGDKLRDGRPIPADGEWLEHEGRVLLCRSGLHASYVALNALYYAPGFMVCRVELDGIEKEGFDKVVARRRRILWRLDAKDVVLAFARRCALDVVDKWNAPKHVRTWLETGEGDVSAVRNAAAAAAAAATAAVTAAAATAATAAVTAAYAGDAAAAAYTAAYAVDAAAAKASNADRLETMIREARKGGAS